MTVYAKKTTLAVSICEQFKVDAIVGPTVLRKGIFTVAV